MDGRVSPTSVMGLQSDSCSVSHIPLRCPYPPDECTAMALSRLMSPSSPLLPGRGTVYLADERNLAPSREKIASAF